jgi:glycine dehydrogenase subunit 2
MIMKNSLIFELSKPGRKGYTLPRLDVPDAEIGELLPASFIREEGPGLPEVSEVDVIRHFVRLSAMNHHVDKGFYPLGSCTMKYNPKVNEEVAKLPGFSRLHPMTPLDLTQGAFKLMYELGEYLKEIAGLDAITLQPSAGAQGEMAGLLIARAFHKRNGDSRTKVITPDSAHGTNPASIRLAGYDVVTIPSDHEGLVDIGSLGDALSEEVAVFMLTNPNTLGKFEKNILQIAQMVHDVGAVMYMDGANLNALLQIVKPGQMGFDILHFNLHKTFSTPHGGGGPGSGPVGVKEHLKDFLPIPTLIKEEDGEYSFDYNVPHTIGMLHSYYGNFLVLVKAYTYIRMLGAEGLHQVACDSILNANYIKKRLEPYYHNPFPGPCMHECVLSGVKQKERGVKTLDIAKRLLDYGVHAPTVYFPLIVQEALMIEPTETESLESLDEFINAMTAIDEESRSDPDKVKEAPHTTPVRRLDEVQAARKPLLKWGT